MRYLNQKVGNMKKPSKIISKQIEAAYNYIDNDLAWETNGDRGSFTTAAQSALNSNGKIDLDKFYKEWTGDVPSDIDYYNDTMGCLQKAFGFLAPSNKLSKQELKNKIKQLKQELKYFEDLLEQA